MTEETEKVASYEERCEAVNAISQPLASKKSTKKLHKLVRKAASSKHIRRGVKEVIKALRKGESGLVILAGDIYPIDVISHLPVYLEEKNIPYLFVPSKFDLGAAASTTGAAAASGAGAGLQAASARMKRLAPAKSGFMWQTILQ